MLNVLSIVGYLGMAGGLLGLLYTRNLFSFSPLVISLQIAAIVLLVWARMAFGRRSFHAAAGPTAGGLVTRGPYRWIRHPIYTAACLFTWAGVAGHWSWMTGFCGGFVVGGAIVRIYCEEVLIAVRYPEYGQYSANTWRMIPYIF